MAIIWYFIPFVWVLFRFASNSNWIGVSVRRAIVIRFDYISWVVGLCFGVDFTLLLSSSLFFSLTSIHLISWWFNQWPRLQYIFLRLIAFAFSRHVVRSNYFKICFLYGSWNVCDCIPAGNICQKIFFFYSEQSANDH